MYEPDGIARRPLVGRVWPGLLAVALIGVLMVVWLVASLQGMPGRLVFEFGHAADRVPVEVVRTYGPALGTAPAVLAGWPRPPVIPPNQYRDWRAGCPQCWDDVPAGPGRLFIATPPLGACGLEVIAQVRAGPSLHVDAYRWWPTCSATTELRAPGYWLLAVPLQALPRGHLDIVVSTEEGVGPSPHPVGTTATQI